MITKSSCAAAIKGKVKQLIKDYLISWSKSPTFDYAVLHDLMYRSVSFFHEANVTSSKTTLEEIA